MLKRLSFLPILFFLIAVLAANCAGSIAVKSYPVPDHGIISFAVPGSWNGYLNQPPLDLPPTIKFSQKKGDQFELLLTIFWDSNPDIDINEPGKIKNLVIESGKEALLSAVEKELNILELRQGEKIGYYFTITDKNLADKEPESGNYKYMSQGIIGMGDLQLIFTFLANKNLPNLKQTALNMLMTARQEK